MGLEPFTEFEEIQRSPLGMRWVFLFAFCVAAVTFVLLYSGGEPGSNLATMSVFHIAMQLFVTLGLPMIIVVYLLNIKQKVIIKQDTIVVALHGFFLSPLVIQRSTIHKISVRPLKAFREFGGWGYRFGLGTGKRGYIWGGKHCIDLTVHNGKRYVISVVDWERANSALGLPV